MLSHALATNVHFGCTALSSGLGSFGFSAVAEAGDMIVLPRFSSFLGPSLLPDWECGVTMMLVVTIPYLVNNGVFSLLRRLDSLLDDLVLLPKGGGMAVRLKRRDKLLLCD